MRILGLDPGSHVTGYALLEDGRLLESGIFKLKSGQCQALRLADLFVDITEAIENLRPDCAGVETPFVGKFPGAVAGLAQARGVLLAALGTAGITVIDITPTEAKKAVGVGGNGDKNKVRAAVMQIFGLKDISTDLSDAVAVAMGASKTAQYPSLGKQ